MTASKLAIHVAPGARDHAEGTAADPSGGDYRLRESLPARELGFVPLDLPAVDSTGKA